MGLFGEISTMARTAGPISLRAAAAEGTKPSAARAGSGTDAIPCTSSAIL